MIDKSVREMSITHEDFFRLLPKAIANRPYKRYGNTVVIEEQDRKITISLSEQSSRKIASLVLPLTTVTLQVEGYPEPDLSSFLDRFFLAYQKGGG